DLDEPLPLAFDVEQVRVAHAGELVGVGAGRQAVEEVLRGHRMLLGRGAAWTLPNRRPRHAAPRSGRYRAISRRESSCCAAVRRLRFASSSRSPAPAARNDCRSATILPISAPTLSTVEGRRSARRPGMAQLRFDTAGAVPR